MMILMNDGSINTIANIIIDDISNSINYDFSITTIIDSNTAVSPSMLIVSSNKIDTSLGAIQRRQQIRKKKTQQKN